MHCQLVENIELKHQTLAFLALALPMPLAPVNIDESGTGCNKHSSRSANKVCVDAPHCNRATYSYTNNMQHSIHRSYLLFGGHALHMGPHCVANSTLCAS